jgi:hypothetical protein
VKWDGHSERRHTERRAGWPQFCAEHDLIQEHTGEHREQVCGKISKLDAKIEREVAGLHTIVEKIRGSIVGKWTFNILVIILIGSMGIMWNELKSINTDIDKLQKNVTVIMSTLHIRVD